MDKKATKVLLVPCQANDDFISYQLKRNDGERDYFNTYSLFAFEPEKDNEPFLIFGKSITNPKLLFAFYSDAIYKKLLQQRRLYCSISKVGYYKDPNYELYIEVEEDEENLEIVPTPDGTIVNGQCWGIESQIQLVTKICGSEGHLTFTKNRQLVTCSNKADHFTLRSHSIHEMLQNRKKLTGVCIDAKYAVDIIRLKFLILP